MSDFPISGYLSNNARTEGEMKTAFEDWLKATKQIPGSGIAETTLSLATDAVTPPAGSGGIFSVDTEAAAATDDLRNIIQTNFPDGSLLLIRSVSAARVVVVKHSAGGAGQLSLKGSTDLSLLDPTTWLLLKRTGTLWEEISRFSSSELLPTNMLDNLGLLASVAANALTMAVKTSAGGDPSGASPVRVSFRSATLTTGTPVVRSVTAALSSTVPSGATLGTTNGVAFRIYFGLQDDAGTMRPCWFNSQGATQLYPLPSESALHSATLLDTGSDSAGVLYASAATSSKAVRWLGYVEISEATAGTWATAPTVVQMMGPGVRRSGEIVQTIETSYATATSNATTTFADTGLTATITPTNVCNRILAIAHQAGCGKNTGNTTLGIKLFRAAVQLRYHDELGRSGAADTNEIGTVTLSALDAPASTSALIYKTQFYSGNNVANALVQSSNSPSTMILQEIFA